MKANGFMAVPVMAGMMLLMLGFFIYDGHIRGGGMMGRMMGGMMGGASRHGFVMRNGLPEEYADLSNPLLSSPENIAEGNRLYSINCASCHGESAEGDGVVGKSLDPPPADLVSSLRMPMVGEAFLF